MVGAVIVTHGQLANELVSAAEMIVGEINHITAVSIGWHDDVDVAREEIDRAIQRVDTGSGVLILTDMFGGTHKRPPASLDAPTECDGVNLPVVISSPRPRRGLSDLARRITIRVNNRFTLASDILTPKEMIGCRAVAVGDFHIAAVYLSSHSSSARNRTLK
jgi:PTS system mannose-specific IIA component